MKLRFFSQLTILIRSGVAIIESHRHGCMASSLLLNSIVPTRGPRVPAQVKSDLAKLQLTSPVCTKEGEKIALSRRVEKHWRLIGWGQIQKGLKMDLPSRS